MRNFKVYLTNSNELVKLSISTNDDAFDCTLFKQRFLTINLITDKRKVMISSQLKYVCYFNRFDEWKEENMEYFI